jgi:hypothetical protein
MTRGHRESLLLRCRAFSSLSSCRFIPALSPRSLLSGQRVRHPALPLRHRRGYAVDFHHGLLAQTSKTQPEVPHPYTNPKSQMGTHRNPAQIHRVSSWRQVKRRNNTGSYSYTFPSRSPRPAHPAVLNRRDFVEAAPTLPGDPGSGCLQLHPTATTAKRWTVSHLHPTTAAPRGALHLPPQNDRAIAALGVVPGEGEAVGLVGVIGHRTPPVHTGHRDRCGAVKLAARTYAPHTARYRPAWRCATTDSSVTRCSIVVRASTIRIGRCWCALGIGRFAAPRRCLPPFR